MLMPASSRICPASGWRVNSSQAAPRPAIGRYPNLQRGRQQSHRQFHRWPPTQSHIGKRFSQPSLSATWSKAEPSPSPHRRVHQSLGQRAQATFASNIPLRVSLVPPDFEMTIQSVLSRFDLTLSITLSIPSGSVLSKNHIFMRSFFGLPSACETNCGPKADPPMPMTMTFSNKPSPRDLSRMNGRSKSSHFRLSK